MLLERKLVLLLKWYPLHLLRTGKGVRKSIGESVPHVSREDFLEYVVNEKRHELPSWVCRMDNDGLFETLNEALDDCIGREGSAFVGYGDTKETQEQADGL